ncbi:MAG: B12-binding domain-containing protein, partial [Dehalococcoidia bacterium]|nr:B12-binding domain-containing protein [Dehalococcoidia bacterium]
MHRLCDCFIRPGPCAGINRGRRCRYITGTMDGYAALTIGLLVAYNPRGRGCGMSKELSMALVELERDRVAEEVKSRAERGESPVQILDECRRGMTIVGERFQKG